MIRKCFYLCLWGLMFLMIASCNPEEATFVPHPSQEIAYSGRVESLPEAINFYWPGSSATIRFRGTSIKARVKDEFGFNYLNAILDGDSIRIVKADTLDGFILLFDDLNDAEHTVELFKRNGVSDGKLSFYGFEVLGEVLPAPRPKERKMEFYGNSISVGMAVEDFTGDSSDSTFNNNYKSYASIVARHFDSQYRCICKSGIGIMISWFDYIMPEVFDRVHPRGMPAGYDFSEYKPDLVVINLFQNDSWLVNRPQHPSFQARFKNGSPDSTAIIGSYTTFLAEIRAKYPEAEIICMLGNMDITRAGSPWMGYVERSVAMFNDPKINTLFVPFKNTPGHPKVDEQKALADSLIGFIEEKLGW